MFNISGFYFQGLTMRVANRLVCFEIHHNQGNYSLKVIDATKIVFEVSKL